MALGDAERLLENFDREQLRVAKEGFGGTREGFGGGTSAAKWAVTYPDWPALRKAVLALTDVSEQVFFDMLMKLRQWFCFWTLLWRVQKEIIVWSFLVSFFT